MSENYKKINYDINLYTLSPIHVGTGEDLDPFSYVITEDSNGKYFCKYDFIKLLHLLGKEDFGKVMKLSKETSELNFIEVRKLIGQLIVKENYSQAITSKNPVNIEDFKSQYNINLQGKKPNFNDLKVGACYSVKGDLAIPGSSLKGAIRTAILQKAVNESLLSDEGANILNGIDDPFKMLSLSDGIKDNTKRSIGYYLNYKMGDLEKPKANRLAGIVEAISQNQPLQSNIIVNEQFSNNDGLNRLILQSIKSRKLLYETINNHYLELFKRECSYIKKYNPEHKFIKKVDSLKVMSECSDNNFAVIKVGYHSGALGVTFIKRKIKIMQERGKYLYDQPEPTTMWYFSLKNGAKVTVADIFPSGWVLLT